MQDDRAELDWIRQIADDPGDLALRLVCADWYEERGDPRGEFVRTQLHLARRGLSRTDRRRFAEREHELVLENVRRWNAPLHRFLYEGGLKNRVGSRRKPIRGWRYRRGFVEELDVDARLYAGHAILLSQLGPIERLVLRNLAAGDAAVRFAACPSLRSIRSMAIRDPECRIEHLERLADSPHVGALKELDLRATRITGVVARQVFDNLHLRTTTFDDGPVWPLPPLPVFGFQDVVPAPVTSSYVVSSDDRLHDPPPRYVPGPTVDERDLGCAVMILVALVAALFALLELAANSWSTREATPERLPAEESLLDPLSSPDGAQQRERR